MKILAIETSCDETAAAVIGSKNNNPIVLSNIVSSQINLHKKYGGVVPEVAARAHIESILPIIDEALSNSRTKPDEIDRIAVTFGPGLIGSLVVGVETAKALSLSWEKPLFPINHLEGHVYANFLVGKNLNSKNQMSNKALKINNLDLSENFKLKIKNSQPEFPLVALLVSGGHTMLIYMKKHLDYKVIGQTRDDAAGEAFDKGAKILGLPYPGGPSIATKAEKGNEKKFKFPLIDLTESPKKDENGFLKKQEPSLDFSFSGLKTALLTEVKERPPKNNRDISDLAASFQKAIVDNLIQNSLRAITKYQPKTFILSGGVAANIKLRKTLESEITKSHPNTLYFIPDFCFCTDNAAMIGAAAYFRKQKQATLNFSADPGLKLKPLS